MRCRACSKELPPILQYKKIRVPHKLDPDKVTIKVLDGTNGNPLEEEDLCNTCLNAAYFISDEESIDDVLNDIGIDLPHYPLDYEY